MFRTGIEVKADCKSALAALQKRYSSSTKLGAEKRINFSFYSKKKEKYAFPSLYFALVAQNAFCYL